MEKRFINIDGMRDELLEMLKTEFLSKEHFNSDTIDVKLSLKDIIKKQIEEKSITEPTIYMTVTAFEKMRFLVEENTGEVAWHGLVEKHENNYIISDIVVFPQIVTGATATGVDNEYEMWLATQPDEIFDKLRMHGHSHVNMGVTPSGTDENYYMNLMTHVQDFYITLITNKKDDYHIRFYDKVNNIFYTEMDLNVCFEDGTTLVDWYEGIKENIREPKREYIDTKKTESKYDAQREDREYYKGDYDWYFRAKKEKEEDNTSRSTPSSTTKKDSKTVYIQLPTNEIKEFINLDYVVNYIYACYVAKAPKINKNDMRRTLAKEFCLAFDPSINNFLKTTKKKDRLEYAILHCDFWEVLANESK